MTFSPRPKKTTFYLDSFFTSMCLSQWLLQDTSPFNYVSRYITYPSRFQGNEGTSKVAPSINLILSASMSHTSLQLTFFCSPISYLIHWPCCTWETDFTHLAAMSCICLLQPVSSCQLLLLFSNYAAICFDQTHTVYQILFHFLPAETVAAVLHTALCQHSTALSPV